MAQTWPVTRGKRLTIRALDILGRASMPVLERILPVRRDPEKSVNNILVIEAWLIGDVVLVTPLLQMLRDEFPAARITLLGKPHAEELLRHSGLIDDFVLFDFPWTAVRRKYDPRRYNRNAIKNLIIELRRRRFDVTLDCRMDVRSNIVAFATGAPRRIGYDFGGGSYLLTDRVEASPDRDHKVVDWLRLGDALTQSSASGRNEYRPFLSVTSEERAAARKRLHDLGFDDNTPIVGVHPGASRSHGRWALEDFAWVSDELWKRHGTHSLVFVDPSGYGATIRLGGTSAMIRTTLRELMAMLTFCDVLICNDSGPMHIADALDVPVVGIFTTGNPRWHRPYRREQSVVGCGTGHALLLHPTRVEVLNAAELQLQRAHLLRPTRSEITRRIEPQRTG